LGALWAVRTLIAVAARPTASAAAASTTTELLTPCIDFFLRDKTVTVGVHAVKEILHPLGSLFLRDFAIAVSVIVHQVSTTSTPTASATPSASATSSASSASTTGKQFLHTSFKFLARDFAVLVRIKLFDAIRHATS
jgi:hypothetical protein